MGRPPGLKPTGTLMTGQPESEPGLLDMDYLAAIQNQIAGWREIARKIREDK